MAASAGASAAGSDSDQSLELVGSKAVGRSCGSDIGKDAIMRLWFQSRRWTVGVLLIGSLLPGCASARKMVWNPFGDRIKDRENRYNFAQVMERNGDMHRAEQHYRKLSDESPKDARYYHRLGVVQVRQGEVNEGIATLKKAHELEKEDVGILNDLGYAYTVEGEYERAELILREAMKLDPRDVRTQNNLAMALGYMGKTEEAYQMFRRNTDEGTARNNLAYIYAQTGHVDLAVKEYSKALTHSPSNKSAAEAIVQLNTLDRALAATPKKENRKVELVSKETEEAPPAIQRRKPVEPVKDSGTDLVQLLGAVEDSEEDTPAEPPSATQEIILPKGMEPADYDWSAVP